jgi:hypothetical protein
VVYIEYVVERRRISGICRSVTERRVAPAVSDAYLYYRYRFAFAACWVVLRVGLTTTPASAQTLVAPTETAPAEQSSAEDQAYNTGSDFARPLNLLQLMYQYRTAPGSGAQKGTIREVTTDTVNLRVDGRIDLAPQWVLATRADLPFLARNPITSENPAGDYLYGVGDVDAQAALIYTLDERWKGGFGIRLVAPTGGDGIGGGKWRAVPMVGVRYAWPELSPGSYFEPLVRYEESIAGDPGKRNVGNLQFAPTLNIGLPDRWFFTFYPSPDIRVNYSDPITGQTGRLFLPFDARIGRKFTDHLAVSLEIALPIIRDYPVYDFKTQLRLNLTF